MAKKSTNKQQLKILVGIMEGRPDIARNFHKGGKEEVARFWQQAEQELNSAGPPMKNVADWKKVWIDQKKYVRQKAAANSKAAKGTGGGPNTQQPLSEIEEAIYNLISMKDHVEGIEAKRFGLPTPNTVVVEEAFPVEYLEVEEIENVVSTSDPPSSPLQVTKKPAVSTAGAGARSKKMKSAADALEAELQVQKEILKNISVGVATMQEQKEVEKRHFEVMESLKREEIEEMRRHNAVLEELLTLKLSNN